MQLILTASDPAQTALTVVDGTTDTGMRLLAGAEWVDEPVVVCGRLITSRKPADLPLFAKALLHALGPAETIGPK